MVKFCDKCGAELNDNVKFCDKCGAEVKFSTDSQNTSTPNVPVNIEEKNMAIALIISFFLAGLGICYAGDMLKGLVIFLISIIINFLALSMLWTFSFISIIIWVIGLILTYQEVEKVNQQKRMLIMNSMN